MKNQFLFSIGSLFAVEVLLSPVRVCHATLESFDPYVFARVLYDSNLFRVSGNDEARALLGTTNKDDTIGHLGAGFKSDFRLSRQDLLVDLELDRAMYDNFDDLDHTRIDGNATWKWVVGNLWSGNLGYNYLKRLRSFNEQSFPEKDMRTEHRGFFDAGYQLTPDWKLIGGIEYRDVSYQERETLDRTAQGGLLQVTYRNTRNTRVGLRAKYTANDLRNEVDVAGVSINNDYDEWQFSGVFYWEATGKSGLEASLGYTDVKYDEIDERDFQGVTGTLTHQWELTGKTRLDTTVWQETSTQEDEISTYVLTRGVRLKPIWSVTPVLSLRGELAYYNDDYKGENDIRGALGLDRREDDTWQLGIYANWLPRRYLNFSVGYRYQDRDSTTDINDFKDNQVDTKVTLQF